MIKIKGGIVQGTSDAGAVDDAGPKSTNYLISIRLPDAQFFHAEYGVRYARSLLARLGIDVDPTFKLEPALDPAPDAQGVRYVTYTVLASATQGAAKCAERELGVIVEPEGEMFALEGSS